MQRAKAKEGKGEAKKCWETSTPGRIGGKNGERETFPAPSLWKQFKVHSQSKKKKQKNKCFLSFMVPSHHITESASKHVTVQNRTQY